MIHLKVLFIGICACYLLIFGACHDDADSITETCIGTENLSTQITGMMKDAEDGSWLGIEAANAGTRVLAITDSYTMPAKLAIRFYRLLIKGELAWVNLDTVVEDWDAIPENFTYSAQTPDGNVTVTLTGSKSQMDANDCFATLTFNIPGLSGKLEEIRFAGSAYLDKTIGEERARWYSIGYGYSWEGLPIESRPELEVDADIPHGQMVCMKELSTSDENDGSADLSGKDLEKLSREFNLPKAALRAAIDVEGSRNEYISPFFPPILFEGHIFWRQLKAHGINPEKYAADYPDVLYIKWDKCKYLGGIREYERLDEACRIDREAAYEATTWGKYQLFGLLYADCGEASVFTFVDKMRSGAYEQTLLWIYYLKKHDWLKYLQALDWKGFAEAYHGKSYKDFGYDKKLLNAYNKYKW